MKKYPFTIKQGDDSGWTPLHIAAQMGNKKFVELLLKNVDSPAYVKNNEGLSTFHIATKEGNVNVMKELITISPDIYELLDNRGQTALHVVAESGKEKAVSFFLNNPGFEGLINEQDKEGNTPMHLAAFKGHDKVVHLLEKGKGLDLNAKNKEGFTTLDYILLQKELDVSKKIWKDILSRLRENGARPSLMASVLKFGIWKAGDGKGMAGSDSVKEENQNNLLVDDKEGSETNLLIATLIATVTFTAAFTVPGGYQSQGVDEGLAVFGRSAAFGAFLIANTFAFALSMTSILVHFSTSLGVQGLAFRKYLVPDPFIYTYYAIIAMLVAFISGTYTVVPHSLGITAAVIVSFFSFPRLVEIVEFVESWLIKSWRQVLMSVRTRESASNLVNQKISQKDLILRRLC
uniref:PGG domain-containing protein n=1 Tax=Fagus sylvatica TaxID=28930 RepID=A0A2N9FW91_FAGSY